MDSLHEVVAIGVKNISRGKESWGKWIVNFFVYEVMEDFGGMTGKGLKPRDKRKAKFFSGA